MAPARGRSWQTRGRIRGSVSQLRALGALGRRLTNCLYSSIRSLQLCACPPQIGCCLIVRRVDLKGAFKVRDCICELAFARQQNAELVVRVSILGIESEDLPVLLFRLLELT